MFFKEILKKDNPFDYIVLGFIMKLFGDVAGFFISYHIADSVFGLISWILIIKGYVTIPDKLKFPFTRGYHFLLSFFLLQCVVMIIRGYLIDYNFIWHTTIGAINYHLFKTTYLLCYLMPFVALIPIRYFNFRLILNYSIIFALITIVLSFAYRNEIIQNSILRAMDVEIEETAVKATQVSFYGTFIFLTLLYKYLPRRQWRINMLGLVVTLLLLVIDARRGGVVLISMILLGALYFRAQSKNRNTRIFTMLFNIVFLVVIAYYILQSSLSSYLLERGIENTRTYVDEAMSSQMSTTDWFFGKGLNGRYYCPIKTDDYLNGWRYGIETGFYNLVLKGGYFLAITYVLLLVIPAINGLFRSNNLFCKAGGYYLLYHLISMWPFGILQFRLDFFIMWSIIVCCMNNQVLFMSDEEIKKSFFCNLK